MVRQCLDKRKGSEKDSVDSARSIPPWPTSRIFAQADEAERERAASTRRRDPRIGHGGIPRDSAGPCFRLRNTRKTKPGLRRGFSRGILVGSGGRGGAKKRK